MKQLVDLLHIILCSKPHESDMMKILDREEVSCYFYLENDIADGEEMADHKLWEENGEKFKISMGFSEDKEALDFVRECIKISHQIQSISNENKFRMAFIKSLL
jgi:hypothetical protein